MENDKISERNSGMTSKSRDWLASVICLGCMFLFFYTACSKLLDHERFLNGLTRVALIGPFASYISWLVPASEFLISILLIIPATYQWGLYGFTVLMILFTGYITSAVLWAKELPCHCGGVIETLSWRQHIWFNLAFIAIAIYGLRLIRSKNNLKKITK